MKSDIRTFVEFCLLNEEFTKAMIKYGIKTPMNLIESEQLKAVSYVANNILIDDNDVLAELFIIDERVQRLRLNSSGDDEDTDETTLFAEQRKAADKSINEFGNKYKYLLELLSCVEENPFDEVCINFMAKVLTNIIKVKADAMCEFFEKRSDFIRKMVELMDFPSVSFALVRLISETDNEKFLNFKVRTVHLVMLRLLQNVHNSNFATYL